MNIKDQNTDKKSESGDISEPEEITEFKDSGYARSSVKLLYYLRHYIPSFKIFRPSCVTGSCRKGPNIYSPFDIFGDNYSYYFDKERKEDFVDFLVIKFLTKNKSPDIGIRKAFTRILHYHGLHWEYCTCKNKDALVKYDS